MFTEAQLLCFSKSVNIREPFTLSNACLHQDITPQLEPFLLKIKDVYTKLAVLPSIFTYTTDFQNHGDLFSSYLHFGNEQFDAVLDLDLLIEDSFYLENKTIYNFLITIKSDDKMDTVICDFIEKKR